MGLFAITLTRTGTATKDLIQSGDFFRALNAGNVSNDTIVINGIQYDLNSSQFSADGATGLTLITSTAPGVQDFAIQNLVAAGFGFVTADEGNTVLQVIRNLQDRVRVLEGT